MALVAFGGAGPLHACALAEELGAAEVWVPENAGVLSALGLAQSRAVAERSRTVLGASDGEIRALAAALLDTLRLQLPEAAQVLCDVDARYDGQSYQLRVSLDAAAPRGIDEVRARFERMHEERFGFAVREPVELVTIHLRALGPAPAPLPLSAAPSWEAEGPMSRVDEDCTLWVPPHWSVRAFDGVARLTREGRAERDAQHPGAVAPSTDRDRRGDGRAAHPQRLQPQHQGAA